MYLIDNHFLHLSDELELHVLNIYKKTLLYYSRSLWHEINTAIPYLNSIFKSA